MRGNQPGTPVVAFSKTASELQSPLTESNRRPSPYHGDALPTELRGRRYLLRTFAYVLTVPGEHTRTGGLTRPGWGWPEPPSRGTLPAPPATQPTAGR